MLSSHISMSAALCSLLSLLCLTVSACHSEIEGEHSKTRRKTREIKPQLTSLDSPTSSSSPQTSLQASTPSPYPTDHPDPQVQKSTLEKAQGAAPIILGMGKAIAAPSKSEDWFGVYFPKTSLNQAQDRILIKSHPGYKVNKDFPHRANVSIKDQNLKATVEIKGDELHFVIADADLTQKGTSINASFSICTEKSCKLYTKQYQW